MSAICGLVRWDGRPVVHDKVGRMTERLRHRGADAGGAWAEGSVGLGNRLLHTTPESLFEQLPLHNPAAGLTLTADARIDNRAELLVALGLVSRTSHPVTDSELILAAYERWGVDCPVHLIGDFAFAIWDARARRLFCARDPMGVKPFYYYRSDRTFAFASEIKGLWAVDGPEKRLNELHVANFLQGHFDDRESTFFDGVLRLPAAHTLIVDGQSASPPRKYWELDAERELTLGSDAEYVEAFRDAFDTAVRCRVRSAFPVGSTLSGGLDSSSIAVTARDMVREQRSEALHTFSAIFPGMTEEERRICDESEFIDAVLETGGFSPHRIHADELTPFHEMTRLLWHLDEPHYGYNLYLHWAIYSVANCNGVRVVLDGVDGDACVSHGWERLAELVAEQQWSEFDEQVEALLRTHTGRRLDRQFWARRFALPYLETLAGRRHWRQWNSVRRVVRDRYGVALRSGGLFEALRPLVPMPLMTSWRRLHGISAPADIVRARLRRRVRARGVAHGSNGTWQTSRAAHRSWLENPLYQDALEMADKCAAGFQIEPRYPFFDRRLMELCVALPARQKLDAGWTRAVLRQSMEGRLPALVQWRAYKHDLGPNFRKSVGARARADIARGAIVGSALLDHFVAPRKLSALARTFAPEWQRPAMTDAAKALFRGWTFIDWLSTTNGSDVARSHVRSRARSATRSELHPYSGRR